MTFHEVDYFDLLRLDGKPARFVVKDNKAWFDCQGHRYDMKAGDLQEREMDLSKGMDLQTLKENSKPVEGNLDVNGLFVLSNLEDEVWLFIFISPEKHMCLLRAESFKSTLGKI